MVSGLSRFLLPTLLCGRQRKVGAAPHRGNANKPLTKQGKANTPGKQTQGQRKQTTNKARKGQHPRQTDTGQTKQTTKKAKKPQHHKHTETNRRAGKK
jgi:hypothetical protein